MCEDKARMLQEYSEAAEAFSNALSTLHHRLAIVPRDEYERLRTTAEAHRLRAEGLRATMEAHVNQHGC